MYFLDDDDLSQPSKSGIFQPFGHPSKETAPAKSSPKSTKNEKKKVKSVKKSEASAGDEDLNYFDELTFKDSLAEFTTAATERVHTVQPPEQSLHDLTDLNEVDRQYLTPVSSGIVFSYISFLLRERGGHGGCQK